VSNYRLLLIAYMPLADASRDGCMNGRASMDKDGRKKRAERTTVGRTGKY